ncbi:FAD-dependent oxidoreductase [Nocardioides glacieisoli]|uniref:FAD-dependent oxidoreductase n=1 Tax=Nocardioides glacieisoli TaxID=1168730 RepID=A0A4Q2RY57_9ACTN|nr:FAD-dependent oxidoreductase [Nocardioides glacieisoli]RYB92553.1 FAD-dependent oxidoreductase [Nocardioides glacieisoli]
MAWDVVVVGGGVAGLVAARALAATGRDVLLLEASPQLGGKLRSAEVAGLTVDVGAEAMLARRPEGLELAHELGAEVLHPTAATSGVWSRGAMRALPRSLMGVPLDLDQLAASGVLSPDGLARASSETPTDVSGDVSVGDLVASRLGDEVVERLVEPLLGGVYAGHARRISAAAAVPQLLAMARRGSLLDQAAGLPVSSAPVFATVPGGMGRLPGLVVDGGGFEARTSATVRELRRTPTGWALTVGPTTHPETIEVAAVVLATPATPTARLLADVAPGVAAELATVEAASVAVVTLACRAQDVPDALFDRSGFLVPPVEQRSIKAATFSFAKWGWVRDLGGPDVVVLRTSLGRHREEGTLQATDEGLVRVSLADLGALAGITARPVDTHVQRWGGALPQYAVGHVDRVARIRAAVADLPGLALCGAAYDGVGIPAVIGSARRAVASLTQAE